MSRLASFKGPSVPSQSPVRSPLLNSPSSNRPSESTYRRKVRTVLKEVQSIAQNWDNLVLVDGVRAVQGLIDARTELDNELSLLPIATLPSAGLVTSKIELMEKRLTDLNSIMDLLDKQLHKMANLIESLETLVYDAYRAKGWKWVHEDPLWSTWTLEKFATELPGVLPQYQQELYHLKNLVVSMLSHSTSFEESREMLVQWMAHGSSRTCGWSEWEDICNVEVERWDTNKQ